MKRAIAQSSSFSRPQTSNATKKLTSQSNGSRRGYSVRHIHAFPTGKVLLLLILTLLLLGPQETSSLPLPKPRPIPLKYVPQPRPPQSKQSTHHANQIHNPKHETHPGPAKAVTDKRSTGNPHKYPAGSELTGYKKPADKQYTGGHKPADKQSGGNPHNYPAGSELTGYKKPAEKQYTGGHKPADKQSGGNPHNYPAGSELTGYNKQAQKQPAGNHGTSNHQQRADQQRVETLQGKKGSLSQSEKNELKAIHDRSTQWQHGEDAAGQKYRENIGHRAQDLLRHDRERN